MSVVGNLTRHVRFCEYLTECETILLDICVSCVLNRVRDLKSILLVMCFLCVPNRLRNVRQFYLSYTFPESAKKSARLKDNPTRHVRFLCLLIRVSDLKSIFLDMCVSYACRIECET